MANWFGTDGIRGTVGEWPMVPEFMLQLGRAAGTVLRGGKREASLVIGRDTRQSGLLLQEALVAGLMSCGVHVVDLGVVPTPAVAWLVSHLEADAGVVVSASHNPSDQNGIKFFGKSGRKISDQLEIQIEGSLAGLLETSRYSFHPTIGSVHHGEIFQELYIQDLLREQAGLNLENLKLVIDCANGAASWIAPQVFSRLGAEAIAIHASPTGHNINLSAGSEHVRRSLQEMGLLIQHHEACFGLAFDGDADRVVFVDETGRLVDGDHMLGMLARYFYQQGELVANAVVTTVMRNSGLKTHLEHLGIRMYETPVGDKHVADKLFELRDYEPAEGKIGLGGEQAGHILIVDRDHSTGDGIRTALFVIQAFLASGVVSLAEFAADIGKTPQIILSAQVENCERLSRQELDAREAEALAIPGVIRVNLRYSGTEPLLRAMLESDGTQSEADLAQIAIRVCLRGQQFPGGAHPRLDILNVTCGGLIEVD